MPTPSPAKDAAMVCAPVYTAMVPPAPKPMMNVPMTRGEKMLTIPS